MKRSAGPRAVLTEILEIFESAPAPNAIFVCRSKVVGYRTEAKKLSLTFRNYKIIPILNVFILHFVKSQFRRSLLTVEIDVSKQVKINKI